MADDAPSTERSRPPGELTADEPRTTQLSSRDFGRSLRLHRYQLDNGLRVIVCVDRSAPIVAYQTWYRVGSRHEKEGKTGLAHFLEHLMFNETERWGHGEFDRLLEAAGAENNAATWLDWTEYSIQAPTEALELMVELESERMHRLVLKEPAVASEREVVANERRYRVDDDVEGAVSELLWSRALERSPYRWPTIGWMQDIQGYQLEDAAAFYRAHYVPSNATLVVVGDVDEPRLMSLVRRHYGPIAAGTQPEEDADAEAPPQGPRTLTLTQPTPTAKLAMAHRAPPMSDADHLVLTLLGEILTGGRASRLHRRLVRELELASDVRMSVGPFELPSLSELWVAARPGVPAEELVAPVEEELARLSTELVSADDLQRAVARTELATLSSLETMEGKANAIGFHETVLGRPAEVLHRLELLGRVTPGAVRHAARRWLDASHRTALLVHPDGTAEAESDDGEEDGMST